MAKSIKDIIGGLYTAGQNTPYEPYTTNIAKKAYSIVKPYQKQQTPQTPQTQPKTSTQGYSNYDSKGNLRNTDVLELARLNAQQPQTQPQPQAQTGLTTTLDQDIAQAQAGFLTPAVQAQIDAISQVYANQLKAAQEVGTQESAAVRALGARSGMTGSRSGLAQEQLQSSRNLERERAIDAEKGAIISNILGEAEQRAIDNAITRRQLLQEENKTALEQLEKSQTRARDDFKQMAGLSDYYWDAVPNDEKQMWIDQTGYEPELAKLLFNQGKGESEGLQWETVWKGNNMVQLGKDPKTGQVMEMQSYNANEIGIPTEADPKFITNDLTGETGWIDQNNPDAGITWLGKMAETEAEKREAEFGYDVALAQAKEKLDGESEETQGLVNAVLENPELFNQLTPTEKGKIAPALNKLGFTSFGKPLSDTAIKEITQTQSALNDLKELRTIISENSDKIGPITGLQALSPWAMGARQVQADIDRVKQRVGKALEGGVLRKEDEEKYKKILGQMTDQPETALYKTDQIIASLEKDIKTYQNQQMLSGRDVPSATTQGQIEYQDGKIYELNGQTLKYLGDNQWEVQ